LPDNYAPTAYVQIYFCGTCEEEGKRKGINHRRKEEINMRVFYSLLAISDLTSLIVA